VLHSSRRSFVDAVGRGGERSVGSSLVNVLEGRITGRRIDLLGGHTEFLSAALPHELTHVVLQDRLPGAMPRWADEGLAILADTKSKRDRHQDDLRAAISQRTTFNVAALLTMGEYPPSDRWGAFYGQSASLANFLIERKGCEQFVIFVERAGVKGYDVALRACYGIADVAELNRLWQRHLRLARLL